MTDTALDIGEDVRSPPPDPALMAALAAAARAASQALEASRPESLALLQTLDAFVAKVQASHVEVPQGSNENVREVVESFKTKYDALKARLDGLFGGAVKEIAKALEDAERDVNFVTLTLFGRTKAGKSTTMEALTGGDGASIGGGKQHTTTKIDPYYYPRFPGGGEPDTPALRIVDTPGIEGFEGFALAEMAERYIDRSDHILFLISDDKAGADELERFRDITTQNKGVTVLLNIKAKDEDLDLLVADPALVFKQHEIDGHTRRICGYLEKRFGMAPPRVIPIHARAAWLSRSQAELPEGVGDRSILRKRSRLSDLEGRIEDFIRHEARLARLRAPRELLLSHLILLKNGLRPLAGEFRQVMRNMEEVSRRLRDGAERARARVAVRFPLLRARFQAASDAIPGMIDEVIAGGRHGAELGVRWQALLRTHGVADAAQWFVAAGQQDFREEIESEVHAATFDYQLSKVDGLDEQLGRYYEAEDGERRNRYARLAIRTASGFGAFFLAGLKTAEMGWGAVVVGAVAAVVGETLADKATEDWERSSKKDMYEKREEIAAKLRDRLWADYRAVQAGCAEWLDKAKEMQTQVVEEIARPVLDSSRRLWHAAVETLDGLDEIADRVNESLVHDLFAAVVPECEGGAVSVTAVAREAGRRTKVMVSPTVGGVNAIAACVGRQGSRIRRIKEALGNGSGEKVDLVDAGAELETQVIQALGLHGREPATVTIAVRAGQTAALVRTASPGPSGLNKRLASKLIGINIIVEEG